MRILHVTHCLSVGGAETMLINLARAQRQLGHTVAICSFYGPAALDSLAENYGIPVHHLNVSGTGSYFPHRLVALCRREAVEIVHMHWGVWLQTALACKWLGLKCVYTNHGNHGRRTFFAHRIAASMTSRIVFLTPAHDPYMERYVGVKREQVRRVPNGIDIDTFSEAKTVCLDGVSDDAVVVGMVARMNPPKDYATFIRAAKIVHDRLPDVHFVAVGDGPRRSEYEELARSLELTGRVHFLGSRTDVASVNKRLAVHVLSTNNEGLPMTILEAMAGDCPVVASDIPQLRWVLEDGRSGLLFPPGNADGLADSLITLLQNPQMLATLRTAAAKRVKTFSLQSMARGYLDVYAECLHSHSGAQP